MNHQKEGKKNNMEKKKTEITHDRAKLFLKNIWYLRKTSL